MSETRDYDDLCMTCVHRPTCTFQIYAGVPIWFCNEFDDSNGPDDNLHSVKTKSTEEIARKSELRTPPRQETDTPSELKGLCMNCEDRDICLLPKPEGGIWHCEEYK